MSKSPAKPCNVDSYTGTIGVAETTCFTVTTRKYARAIFFMTLSDTSGGKNQITLRRYDDTPALVDSIIFPVIMNDVIVLGGDINSPILMIPAGWQLRAVSTLASVELFVSYYDIG